MQSIAPANEGQSAKMLTTAIYVLYAISLLAGITALVAIIINYVKKGDVAGTLMESHFRWQIRTFWFALLWFLVALLLSLVGLFNSIFFMGWPIMFATYIWYIYRIVKGFVNLSENKPMYVA